MGVGAHRFGVGGSVSGARKGKGPMPEEGSISALKAKIMTRLAIARMATICFCLEVIGENRDTQAHSLYEMN